MSGVPCPHCGQPTSEAVELVDLSTSDKSDPLSPSSSIAGGEGLNPRRDRLDESVVRSAPLLNPTFLATLATLIVVVFAVGAAIGSGNPSTDDNGDPTAEEASDRRSGDPAAGSDGLSDQSGAAGVDLGFPPSDDHLDADVIAATFRDEVDLDGGYTVYYTTESGVQSVSAGGVSDPQVNVANTFNQIIGFPLLSDGNQTWAIDAANPETVFLVSTQFVVVEADMSGSVAFIDPRGETVEVGVSSLGGWRSGIELPPNSEVLAVPGRGLLVTPPTGGTFLVGGTGQLSQLSDDRVVAAGVGSEVFRRCDEELACDLYVRLSDAEGVRSEQDYPLDLFTDGKITVSPQGRYVATTTDEAGPATLIETRTGKEHELGEYSVVATGWAPDSSFLAVATDSELLIVSTATGDVVTLPLPTTPSASSLLVDRR